MYAEISKAIERLVKELFSESVDVVLTRPDEQFGDFSTNIALQLSKKLGKSPRDVAGKIASQLKHELIAKTEVAGPGFINITLTDKALSQLVGLQPSQSLRGKTVVAEYSDPNPFKVLHAGHLYTSIVGDAIANLLENAGAKVHRVNFGGDVGMHVAKMLWAITTKIGDAPEKLDDFSKNELNELVTESYISGTAAYEDDGSAKEEIVKLNKQVYAFHAEKDYESALAKIYWKIRSFYYDVYFKDFYTSIGTKFDKFYPESETAPLGLKTVKEQLAKGVYKVSDGAVIFDGEPYGLHARVFINSEGLPTYEAKDVGLILKKYEDYHFDYSVVITGNDIVEYMKVVLKSIEQFAPELAKATTHITHGIVKLEGGQKMSSRKGNILRATDVLDAASRANKTATGKEDRDVVLGAVKYSFLKQRTGGDIIYDPKESVSLEGNSGPYLQYAHARARSILRKGKGQRAKGKVVQLVLEASERSLVRKIGMYAEVVEQATEELMPHLVCTYLYELAQTFNRFYENNKVIGNDREDLRLELVEAYASTLKNGLGILGIVAPEQM